MRLVLFVAVCEAGVLWRFARVGAGPQGIESLARWSPVVLGAALLAAGAGGSLLLRLGRGRGIFGRLELRGRVLSLAGWSCDLRQPCRIEGRLDMTDYPGVLRLPYMDGHVPAPYDKPTPERRVGAAALVLDQRGRTATLYALYSGKREGFPPARLNLETAPLPRPGRGPRMRLDAGELAEVLAALAKAGARPENAGIATSGAPATARAAWHDPRAPFRSLGLVVAAGLVVVALAAIAPVRQVLAFEPEPDPTAEAAATAEVARQMRMLRARTALDRSIAAHELRRQGARAAAALPALRTLAIKDPRPETRAAAAEAVAAIEAAVARPQSAPPTLERRDHPDSNDDSRAERIDPAPALP